MFCAHEVCKTQESADLLTSCCSELCNWFVTTSKKGWVNDARDLETYMEYQIIDAGYW